jgi:hypothetical protein
MEEAKKAFLEIKKHLCSLPTLAILIPWETITRYLAGSAAAISSFLMVDRQRAQIPIYFLSCTLKGSEERYSPMGKLALSLIHTARHLRRYFQAYPIQVVNEKHIQQVLRRPETYERLAKWAIELGAHTIDYKPWVSMKGQVLTDFFIEVPVDEEEKEAKREEKVT